MDTDAFLESVRTANETALSRLGSSKSLYALTDGEMETVAVLSVMADVSHAAAVALEEYATGAASSEAADALSSFGDLEADRAVAIGERLAEHYDHDPHEVVDALSSYGAGTDASDAERLGAVVGYALVAKKLAEQVTGFFTGEADPQTASDFRSYGNELDAERDVVLDALAVVGDEDPAEDAASAAASAVIQHAYDVYTARLEAMGVNPKPVC